MMGLKDIKGTGKNMKATIATNIIKKGTETIGEVKLKMGDSLFVKTDNEDHQGYKVENIGKEKGNEFVRFENEVELTFESGDGGEQRKLVSLSDSGNHQATLPHAVQAQEQGHQSVVSFLY